MLNKLRATFPEFDWSQDTALVPSRIEVPFEKVFAPLGDKFVLSVWGPKTPKGPCYHAYLQSKEERGTFQGALLVHVPSCFCPVKAMEAMQRRIAVLDEVVEVFETLSGFRP